MLTVLQDIKKDILASIIQARTEKQKWMNAGEYSKVFEIDEDIEELWKELSACYDAQDVMDKIASA